VNLEEIAHRRSAKLVHANGIDIAYREAGKGPPLVLLHGAYVSSGPAWVGSQYAHVDFLESLARHFRVILPDTRGSGATAHDGSALDFDALVADVVGLMNALDLHRPMVAGFSEGGATATLLAIEHPDRVSALVNHAGFDYFDQPDGWEASFRDYFGGSPEAQRADPDRTASGFAASGMNTFFETMQNDYDDAQGEGHWRQYIHELFDRCLAPFRWSLADLSRITVPSLVIAGDRDFFCTPEATVRFHRALPDSALGIIPATGHEITPLLISTIAEFLSHQDL
jgi:pimeloyl-ACP methyl ester carboxylesterase